MHLKQLDEKKSLFIIFMYSHLCFSPSSSVSLEIACFITRNSGVGVRVYSMKKAHDSLKVCLICARLHKYTNTSH